MYGLCETLCIIRWCFNMRKNPKMVMKTLNLRNGQQTKQRNRILVDLISKIWDTSNCFKDGQPLCVMIQWHSLNSA